MSMREDLIGMSEAGKDEIKKWILKNGNEKQKECVGMDLIPTEALDEIENSLFCKIDEILKGFTMATYTDSYGLEEVEVLYVLDNITAEEYKMVESVWKINPDASFKVVEISRDGYKYRGVIIYIDLGELCLSKFYYSFK